MPTIKSRGGGRRPSDEDVRDEKGSWSGMIEVSFIIFGFRVDIFKMLHFNLHYTCLLKQINNILIKYILPNP